VGTVPGLDAPLTTPPPGLLSVVHIAVWVMCGVCVVLGSVLVAAMVGFVLVGVASALVGVVV